MGTKKLKCLSIIFAIAILMITFFILLNSFRDFETSHNSSGAVVEIIVPDSAKDVLIDDKTPEFYIRKAAHYIEYAVLGVAVALFSLVFSKSIKSKITFWGFELFYVLAIAVVDEHIQSLSDRSSSTNDILLDFAGAVSGIAIIFLVYFIITARLRKKQKNTEHFNG